MPDPEMVSRAHRAALTLERAWERWRIMHGLSAQPMPPVSSYVGYSIEEPWGRPRVVFGVDAHEAEMLAALLDRHECVGPFYRPDPAAEYAHPESADRWAGGAQPAGHAPVPGGGGQAPVDRDPSARDHGPTPADVRVRIPEQAPAAEDAADLPETSSPPESGGDPVAAAPEGEQAGGQLTAGHARPRDDAGEQAPAGPEDAHPAASSRSHATGVPGAPPVAPQPSVPSAPVHAPQQQAAPARATATGPAADPAPGQPPPGQPPPGGAAPGGAAPMGQSAAAIGVDVMAAVADAVAAAVGMAPQAAGAGMPAVGTVPGAAPAAPAGRPDPAPEPGPAAEGDAGYPAHWGDGEEDEPAVPAVYVPDDVPPVSHVPGPRAGRRDRAEGRRGRQPAARHSVDTGNDRGDQRPDGASAAGHGVPENMATELAGWAAGELPGQAAARLAAWAASGRGPLPGYGKPGASTRDQGAAAERVR